jgi:hypothetical protein
LKMLTALARTRTRAFPVHGERSICLAAVSAAQDNYSKGRNRVS